jgi:hypothetical protein
MLYAFVATIAEDFTAFLEEKMLEKLEVKRGTPALYVK